MAYKLKSTGIAANCTMCIAVDPDTGTIKDFASAAVTADMTVDAGVTIGTLAWDGNTRSYFKCSSNNIVKFGTNKPTIVHNKTTNTALSLVACTRYATPIATFFGVDSNNYFAPANVSSGGTTSPQLIRSGANFAGTSSNTAGEQLIMGFSAVVGGNVKGYRALHSAASMTVAPSTTLSGSASDISWALNRLCGRNDQAATTYTPAEMFLLAAFDTELAESDFDALRDDWFGTMLEVDAGSPPAGTVTIGTITPTSDGASVAFTYSAADQTGFEYRIDGGTPASAGTTSPLVLTGMSPGTYDVEIRATNAAGAGAWSTASPFTVPAAPVPVAFDSGNPIPNFTPTVGVAFSFDFADRFTGSETPFTYALQAGALPAGLSLAGSVISGTPTTAEMQTGLVIRATDQDAATADSNAFSMTVSAAAAGGSTVIVNLIGF